MAPYNPPNAHFCEISAFDKVEDNLKLIGPKGQNFYRLTRKLNIEYLWWSIERNKIEIWGAENMLPSAHKYLNEYMKRFYKNHCIDETIHVNKKVKY